MVEVTAEDRARMRKAQDKALGVVMNALVLIPIPFWGKDKDFIGYVCRMQPDMLSERQREHVTRVAWRLRRYLPAHLAPKCNPEDPIVREMDRKGEVHV
nr:hypothetical protein [uncultured Rhodopila sp.]